MKKNFLLAMFVMLMTSFSSFAQDQKEYNMVITLNNGTTVTLGHNDIKEITFNDGAVSISGNMVNTIDSLRGVTLDLNNMIKATYEENLARTEEAYYKNRNLIEENMSQLNDCMKMTEQNCYEIKESKQQIEALAAQNTILTNNLTDSQNAIEQLKQDVASQNAEIKDLKAYIQILQDMIEQLNAKIDNK